MDVGRIVCLSQRVVKVKEPTNQRKINDPGRRADVDYDVGVLGEFRTVLEGVGRVSGGDSSSVIAPKFDLSDAGSSERADRRRDLVPVFLGRGDDIVMEYQELLFDQLLVDPRNFIYASELNPFDVYRQVRRAALHYHEVLGLIGGCRVALSALCSKVMSVGILLVAYELKTTDIQSGIAHIECQSYDIPKEAQIDVDPVSIWVAGECYKKA
jgi:hypothetical protein